MMTLLRFIDRYMHKDNADTAADDDDRWIGEAAMVLDQVVQFFENEWDGKGGLRWRADVETVCCSSPA